MIKQSFLITLSLAVLTIAATASVGQACFMRSPQPVHVWLDHINVDITDQLAVKTYNCTFKNPNPRAVVGATCYMELEPGAQVDDMAVVVDGKEMKAEILDVEKAKSVFTDIVKNGGSPALLEYFGNQLIQTRVPRIAANGTVTVKLTYTTVLKKKGGLVRLQMLNTNPKASMQSLKSASVTVNIRSQEPIKNIYSPTHPIKIVEKEGWDVAAEWSQENYLPKHPFVLYYQVTEEQVGASVVAHREAGEDGTFMLMLSPTFGKGKNAITDSQILPKDVVFCVDTSGSMLSGNKMEQARAALKYCVESLRVGDRFNIVDFSTVPRHFHDGGLLEVNEQSRARALRYVSKLSARGGTAIQDALNLSLDQLGQSDRLKMIVFATDGLPTIGERNPQAILQNVAKTNKEDVRIFVFGEGYDVNTTLLDFLALDHRGEADYILPEEDITEKISRFFDRVGSPIMTDLKIEVSGVDVTDIYPPRTPDIFRGEQVIVYGRYRAGGEAVIRLSGYVAGKRTTFEYPVTFPNVSDDDKSAFVPRLWAGQKIDLLLNEIRKAVQPDKELIDEVTRLAKRFGIVTPYTSFLVADDMVAKPAYQLNEALRRRVSAAKSAPRDVQVRQAKEQALARRKSSKGGFADLDLQVEAELKRRGRTESSLAAIRYIGTRTFYQQNKVWQESLFDPHKHKNIETVRVGSDKYFNLLKQDARLAKYLALEDVVLQVKNQWYRIEGQRRKGS